MNKSKHENDQLCIIILIELCTLLSLFAARLNDALIEIEEAQCSIEEQQQRTRTQHKSS